jgi:hypothetical protein
MDIKIHCKQVLDGEVNFDSYHMLTSKEDILAFIDEIVENWKCMWGENAIIKIPTEFRVGTRVELKVKSFSDYEFFEIVDIVIK